MHSLSPAEIQLVVAMVLLFLSVEALLHPPAAAPRPPVADFILWLAQGFGVGRIPVAPGTFGSLLGLLWFALLVASGSWMIFLAGMVLGLALSVRWCGIAEKMLGQKDPPSVVLDEIAAMPVCFVSWLGILVAQKGGALPGAWYFFSQNNWPLTLAVFATFRLFDVFKPAPLARSQSLPGGWGVTLDDLLAAVYVNVLVLAGSVGRLLVVK